MANNVTEWKNGQNPTPGTASVGYPYCDFTWNDPDDSNDDPITSEAFSYPGRYFTLIINADGATTAADYAWTILGTNDKTLADAKWGTLGSNSMSNAVITGMSNRVTFNVETLAASIAGGGIWKWMKLKLDPSADPGPAITLRIGLNAPPVGSKA